MFSVWGLEELFTPLLPGPCAPASSWPQSSRGTRPQGSPLTPLVANPPRGEHPGASCSEGSVLSSLTWQSGAKSSISTTCWSAVTDRTRMRCGYNGLDLRGGLGGFFIGRFPDITQRSAPLSSTVPTLSGGMLAAGGDPQKPALPVSSALTGNRAASPPAPACPKAISAAFDGYSLQSDQSSSAQACLPLPLLAASLLSRGRRLRFHLLTTALSLRFDRKSTAMPETAEVFLQPWDPPGDYSEIICGTRKLPCW